MFVEELKLGFCNMWHWYVQPSRTKQ